MVPSYLVILLFVFYYEKKIKSLSNVRLFGAIIGRVDEYHVNFSFFFITARLCLIAFARNFGENILVVVVAVSFVVLVC